MKKVFAEETLVEVTSKLLLFVEINLYCENKLLQFPELNF